MKSAVKTSGHILGQILGRILGRILGQTKRQRGVRTVLHRSAAFASILIVSSLPLLALAEEAVSENHEGSEIAVPFAVALQTINFIIFFGFLYWMIRHPVKNYFTTREAKFKHALVKAEQAKLEAEQRKRDITTRIDELARTSARSLSDAKAEAEALKFKIVQEASEMSTRLKEDAHRTAEFEIERAKKTLRDELLSESLILAQKVLADKIVEGDQKRLQTEFVDKIQVVR